MIRLTRECRFSLLPVEEAGLHSRVTNSWAGWPSAEQIAPHIALLVTVEGTCDASTGFLLNIVEIDRFVREQLLPRLSAQMSRQGPKKAENLLLHAWRQGSVAFAQGPRLVAMELRPTPYLKYSIDIGDPHMLFVTQQFEFSASHRLHCPKLSDKENRELFGKCNNPSGHGHNYLLDVTLAGQSTSGIGLALSQFEACVQEAVLSRFDHKHLNTDTSEFRDLNPTVENIAMVVWSLLVERLAPARLVRVRVYETPKTWAEYSGSGT